MILNWFSEKKSWKFLKNFSFFFTIFSFQDPWLLTFPVINSAELWSRPKCFPLKYSSRIQGRNLRGAGGVAPPEKKKYKKKRGKKSWNARISLNESRRHTYENDSSLRDIGKDIRGLKWPLGCLRWSKDLGISRVNLFSVCNILW